MKMANIKSKIIDLLKEEPMTIKEVANELNFSTGYVGNIMKTMEYAEILYKDQFNQREGLRQNENLWKVIPYED
jgi:predicted transcriptional regulator